MWPVFGHEHAIQLFQQGLEKGIIHHAYLIVGPNRIGKGTLARSFAQALNCSGDEKPCGTCLSCKRIEQGNHPDVQVIGLPIDEKSKEERVKKEIGIDQIRGLQHDASLHPYQGRYRVFIIDGAEHFSTGASNCLLKILEEPPAQVTLILLAASAVLLPATVVSRCQKIELGPLPLAKVQEVLLRWGAEPSQAQLLAHLSSGRVGWALDALKNPSILKNRAEILDRLIDLRGGSLTQRFVFAGELANKFAKDRESVQEIIGLWLSLWRDLLLLKGGCDRFVTNLDYREGLLDQADRLGLDRIKRFAEHLRDATSYLEQNVNARLTLEMLMLRLPPSA